jgi:hypothetical protein
VAFLDGKATGIFAHRHISTVKMIYGSGRSRVNHDAAGVPRSLGPGEAVGEFACGDQLLDLPLR